MIENKKPIITQHQKRINIIEILYQYFLNSEPKKDFAEHLTKITNFENKEQIEMIKEILWHQDNLIDQIQKYLKNNWKFKNLKPIEKAILILASYEILYTNTDKAIIINEAIILAKQYCNNNTYKYINGVLDKINK